MQSNIPNGFFARVEEPFSVALENVRLSYSNSTANNSFSLSVRGLHIESRTIHCVYGTNGCGKTTLLRFAAGLVAAREGRMSWRGIASPRPGTDHILVTQAGPMPHWSVWQNVCAPMLNQGRPKEQAEERAATLLELLGLAGLEKRYPHQLSAGQQQRTVLARALSIASKILLLDEIMSGQSEYWAGRIALILKEFASIGGMVIMVSHDPEWVAAYANRVTHIVSDLGDAVSSTHFFAGFDGDVEGWMTFRRARYAKENG